MYKGEENQGQHVFRSTITCTKIRGCKTLPNIPRHNEKQGKESHDDDLMMQRMPGTIPRFSDTRVMEKLQAGIPTYIMLDSTPYKPSEPDLEDLVSDGRPMSVNKQRYETRARRRREKNPPLHWRHTWTAFVSLLLRSRFEISISA